jgi:hypothetical protein
VVNFESFVLCVVHQLFELFAEQVNFPEIKRTKISEERLVNQVVVDAEVEGVLARLGWGLVTDPVQTIGDDLNRLIFCRAGDRGLTVPSLAGLG